MNTKRITVELAEKEIIFLKQYAKVYKTERDIDWTSDPIVLVQKPVRLPCPEDSSYRCGIFYYEPDENQEWENKEDLIKCILEEYKLNESQKNKLENFFDNEYEDEFNTFFKPDFKDIDINIKKCWYQIQWQTVAYFLTIAEAERYCKYQAHNLHEYRIYTENAGYANAGDYPMLTKTLLKMGEVLNYEENEQ